MNPVQAPAQPGINPYTGKPLGGNEYVGVAGSEAENAGKTRIPPPGWWDPSNANYERRNYYIGPDGKIVAREAGYSNPNRPFDTGREGEANTEYESRAGTSDVRMSEPGVPTWGPGQTRPTPGALLTPGRGGGVSHPQPPPSWLQALLGGLNQQQRPNFDPGVLEALIAQLRGRVSGGRSGSYPA